MGNDAEPRWQSLFPSFFFSIFDLEIYVIRIFELSIPTAAELPEAGPITLFTVTQVFDYFEVGLGAQVFHLDLKRSQEVAAQPGALLQFLENLHGVLKFLVEQKEIFVNT